ncbi:hypothetical protein SSTU70S_01133 [Stutzerimonas stutzeri]
MLRKLRFPALLMLIAALLVAVGYWNIRPESFMQQPAAVATAESPIDFYVLNARTVQFQPDGKRQVVRDVSLSIESGQIVGLLGPNGAGKTTCFYMIVGLVGADRSAC